MSPDGPVPDPWRGFLAEIDSALASPTELVLMGGFVISLLYGLDRETQDLDYCSLTQAPTKPRFSPSPASAVPFAASSICIWNECQSRRFQTDLKTVSGASSQKPSTTSAFSPSIHTTLLSPNWSATPSKDQQDVIYLARVAPFGLDLLRQRYQVEMRRQLGRPDREDFTFQTWIEMIQEDRENSKR